jgi:hypothetical protein
VAVPSAPAGSPRSTSDPRLTQNVSPGDPALRQHMLPERRIFVVRDG